MSWIHRDLERVTRLVSQLDARMSRLERIESEHESLRRSKGTDGGSVAPSVGTKADTGQVRDRSESGVAIVGADCHGLDCEPATSAIGDPVTGLVSGRPKDLPGDKYYEAKQFDPDEIYVNIDEVREWIRKNILADWPRH